MGVWRRKIRRKRGGVMGYLILALLWVVGVTLVDSLVIAFIAGLLGIGISFKVIFFVVLVINFFVRRGSK